jgi:hypothetical protein
MKELRHSLMMFLLLFVALKLTHQIDWSWWWVLAPLWVPVALLAVVFAISFAWTWKLGVHDEFLAAVKKGLLG